MTAPALPPPGVREVVERTVERTLAEGATLARAWGAVALACIDGHAHTTHDAKGNTWVRRGMAAWDWRRR